MLVTAFGIDIALVYVVGPYRIESRDITGHAGHETGEESRNAET
jgi:hypothetical protein